MSFTEDLANKVRAGYALCFITAKEEWRAAAEIAKLASERKWQCAVWSVTVGWRQAQDDGRIALRGDGTTDPNGALDTVKGAEPKENARSLWVFLNYHRFLDDPVAIQKVKDLIPIAKAQGKTMLLVCNLQKLPDELQADVCPLTFGLPDRALLKDRLALVLEATPKAKRAQVLVGTEESILEAALGMTTREAEDAFALSLVEAGKIDPALIAREKAQAVGKSGFLEFYEPPKEGLAAVGGLENVKAWLEQRQDTLASAAAREYGLLPPRGLLFVGPPGTGKSLTAKAIAAAWHLPLIRLDIGRLYGGVVGQTESQTREALALADAVAPCVLFIDEMEKGLAGSASSGSTDSGVSARLGGTLLTWMEERKRPVFLVGTVNNAALIPAPFLRRFDEVFAVDLPGEADRKAILEIHLRKRGRDPAKFKLALLAGKPTELFSGAELEKVVVKAMFAGFARKEEFTTEDLLAAAKATVPVAVTSAEEIQAMRQWCKTRAKPASAEIQSLEDQQVRAYLERRIDLGLN